MENITFAKRKTGWLGGGTSCTEEKIETSIEEVSEKIQISYEIYQKTIFSYSGLHHIS